ncbi:MAG: segregation and condensation protein A [Breznakia sp.]
MSFEVTIEEFAGPLDLMLHLIKENKLDLFDLDMNALSDQYLAYLNSMEKMSLEIASEFLSELAGLIEYKSKKLLPKEKIEIVEEYEEDQRDKLVRRLLEYQKFKEASETFLKKYEERSKQMEKPISKETDKWLSQVIVGEFKANPYDLIKAMNRVIRRYHLQQPLQAKITIKEMSVDERIICLRERLKHLKTKISFDELCKDCTNLHMIIISFLAILDFIKNSEISFVIDKNDVIWIKSED